MQSGKRQRRQSAALVVQSLWSATTNSSKKKTTPGGNNTKSASNNRPVLEVPPMGFGPIREPNGNDVLCGRGGLINGSPGNVQFRNIVSKRKKEYNAKTTKRHEKAHMAAEIVKQIRSMNPPGRFLREDANGLWFDVGDARAIRKTGQALREAAPAIRQEGEGTEPNPATGKEDDKVSDSGSEEGKKEEANNTTAAGSLSAASEKKGSPKRKKNESSPVTKKEIKGNTKDESTSENPAKRSSAIEATPIADAHAAAHRNSSTRQSGKRNWLPSMMGGSMRRSSASDAASVSAETVRSSQTYLIPQSALGPHITNAGGAGATATPVVAAMPRMSPGAVFSNSTRRSSATEHPPTPVVPHPYQHAHYPYPYAHHMPPPMHPHHPHHHPMMAMHPAQYHHPLQPSAVPVPMMPTRGTLPREITEDAFGMNFFPTRDVNMEPSENASNCTLSDISGLSSSMTPGDQRKQHKQKQQQQQQQQPPKKSQQSSSTESEAVPSLLQPPTITSGQGQQQQQQPQQQHQNNNNNNNMEEVSMLDTTSSLPSFSDILDDVDMASATSGGAGASSLAMASISSSSVAKMMMAPPPAPPAPPAPPQLPPQIPARKRVTSRGDSTLKENSNSTGSCLSGKGSEISLPSSCGTALSQFSDSFMALHLSDHHGLE